MAAQSRFERIVGAVLGFLPTFLAFLRSLKPDKDSTV
jgi:hypothetical protein